ncbi:hypothetical protein CF326_g9095 [Tilletia indica]|nr:hypothetical protein CF326_g9095 [Tilletia indica]
MQLNSKLSLVLCAFLAAQAIVAAPSSDINDAAELVPRSGFGNGLGLDNAGVFGGYKSGKGYGRDHGKGKGGKKFFADKKFKKVKAFKNADKDKAAAAINAATHFKAAAAQDDAKHHEADLKKVKKIKVKGSGKGGFDTFDRRDGGFGFGLDEGLGYGYGNGVGLGLGGIDGVGGYDGGLGGGFGTGGYNSFQQGGSNFGGFAGGMGIRSFDGGKGGFHKKEKVVKLAKHLQNDNKHKAAAKVDADAKFDAAAAHKDAHLDKLAAKKIKAEKKKIGFGKFF